ncbi:MAG TPA: hypothetical protein VNO33_10045 [Kofleriaceae bacterium]|nr:hypothetical protein [Kofleriaceae bacterium]
MRRLVLLTLSLVCALSLSTAVVACGGDDSTDDGGTVDGGTGSADAAGGTEADAGSDEADAGDPHGVAPR